MAMRKQYKDIFLKKHNLKLGFMSLFIKASSVALQQMPTVNAGKEILNHLIILTASIVQKLEAFI